MAVDLGGGVKNVKGVVKIESSKTMVVTGLRSDGGCDF